MKHANKVKITFEYTNAADSAKPGYLQKKFDRLRAKLREEERKRKENDAIVRPIKGAAK